MKKLYMLMVGLMIAMAANAADYYLIGGFNGWTLKDSRCKFVEGTGGIYTLDLPNGLPLTNEFKINDGTWSNANANFGGSALLTLGQTYSLTSSGTSGNIKFADSGLTVPNAHLEFNPTAKTLIVTGKSETATTIYGLHTDIFGNSSWETVNMTEQQDGTWVLSKEATVAGNFGIKAMNSITNAQTAWYSTNSAADATIEVGKTVKVVENGSTNFAIAKGTYTFTFNPKTLDLTVTGKSEGEAPEQDPYEGWWFNLLGDFNNWQTDNSGVQITQANPIAKWTNQAIGTSGFKIKTWDGSSDTYYISESSTIALNEWTQFYVDTMDGAAVKINGATDDCVYDVEYNAENQQVKVTLVSGGTDIPTPPTPTTYDVYVVGGANGWDLASTAYQFERQGETNVYTLTSDEAFAKEWKIRIDPKDWDLTYGAGEGLTLTPDTEFEAWCGSSNNFPAIDGKVTLTFTLVDGSYEAFGSTPATFKYTVDGTDIPTPPTPTTYDVYVVGGANGWDLESTAYQFARQGETNVYTLTSDEAFAQEWKIRIDPKDWDLTYGASEGLTLTPDTNIDAWCGSSNNFPAIEGKVTLTFTLVDGSYEAFGSTPATFKYTVESTEEPTPEEPLDVTFDFTSYDNIKSYSPYVPALDVWTADGANKKTDFEGASIDGAKIDIAQGTGSKTPAYYYVSSTPRYDMRFYAGNVLTVSVPSNYDLTSIVIGYHSSTTNTNLGKTTLVEGQPGQLSIDGKNVIWTPSPIATYAASGNITSIKFTTAATSAMVNSITVKANVVTGVEEVEIDANAPVEYYNLQGIRVANPEKGIYIVRQGNKVTKILK